MNLTEAFEILMKARKMDVGTITTRAGGRQYQKQSNGKWTEYRGAKPQQNQESGAKQDTSKTSTNDLKGNPKEPFMYKVGDFSAYKPVEGAKKVKLDIGEFNIVKEDSGYYVITDPIYGLQLTSNKKKSAAIAEANRKLSVTNVTDMQKTKELAEKSIINTQKSEIRKANYYDDFVDAVKEGKMTYKEAISIIESADLTPSDELLKLKEKKRKKDLDIYAKYYKNIDVITTSKMSKPEIHKYLAVAGVPKNFEGNVYFDERSDKITVTVTNDDLYMKRRIGIDEDNKGVIENVEFRIKNPESYKGTDIFYEQVKNASREGFNKIETDAYRSSGWNGYYTWLRLGYEPKYGVDSEYIQDANEELGTNIKSITELMYSQEGRDWWKENGKSFEATFDLSENSYSMKTLENYVKERNKK